MVASVMNVRDARQKYPDWRELGKIRKVAEDGTITADFAYGGESVAISPRKGAVRCRVRPLRPVVFFAAWCHEQGLLPTPFTPEECGQPEFYDILASLWEENRFLLSDLESPKAVCDNTAPDLKTGYSFTILKALVQPVGMSQSASSNGFHTISRPVAPVDTSALMRRIQAAREAAAKPTTSKKS